MWSSEKRVSHLRACQRASEELRAGILGECRSVLQQDKIPIRILIHSHVLAVLKALSDALYLFS